MSFLDTSSYVKSAKQWQLHSCDGRAAVLTVSPRHSELETKKKRIVKEEGRWKIFTGENNH